MKVFCSGGVIRPTLIYSGPATLTKIQSRGLPGLAAHINPGRIEVDSEKLLVEAIGGDVLTDGGGTDPVIQAAGLIVKLSARAQAGDGGTLGVYPPATTGAFGEVLEVSDTTAMTAQVFSGTGGSAADINLIRGDEGINGIFKAGVKDGDCKGQGLIKKMQTGKSAKIIGEVYVSDPDKIKFVGDKVHDGLKINDCATSSTAR